MDSPVHGTESYRLLFERSPQPTWVIDRETLRFLAVNDAAVRQYGYSRDEFLRMTARDIRPPLEVARLEAVLPLREGDAPDDGSRWVHRRRDGSLVDVVVAAAAIEFGGRAARLVTVRDVTDAVRAERALRESERRFRSAMEHAPIGMALVGMDGRWLVVNHALCALLERDEAELLSLTFQDVTHPDDLGADLALLQQLVAGEIPWYELEKRYLRRDGRPVWILLTVSLVRDEAGAPLHFISQIQDIDTRRRLEEALRSSEEHFRSLIENASDVITVLDAAGTIRYESPSVERVLGYRPEALVGTDVFALVHPDDVAGARDAFTARVEGRDAATAVELRFRHRDGRWRVLEARGANRLADPAVGGIIVNSRDVTERREAQEALRAEEARFIRIASNAPGMIYRFVLRADGGVEFPFVSDGAREIYALEPEEIVRDPQSIVDVVHPADRPEFDASVAESAERLTPWTWEGRVRIRTGQVKWLRGTSRPARNADGDVVWDGMLSDVTPLKEAEARIAAYARELERSNRELQDFAYVASHDLQEPLRKIRAFGDRLAARFAPVLGEQGADYVARMQNAAERMQTLIGDLLEFSRVRSRGRRFAPVSLDEVAREVLADLETRIRATGGRVDVDPLPVLDADRTQMRQLLQNLVGNALKFHRPGEAPRVRVTGEVRGTGDEARVELRVADEGIGFDEKYLDRIFSPFQRLHGREAFEGTGMGLAICRRIAERHGGTIRAASAPGEGALFTVELPLHPPHAEENDD